MLLHRQDIFAQEYLKDGNATQAAIRAGYSKNSAGVTGYRLLRNVNVQQRWESLAELSIFTLADIMTNSRSQNLRLKAASEMIDLILHLPDM